MNVKDVQKMLYGLGLKNIYIDGIIGVQTELYIKGVQYALGVEVDGIVGGKTLRAIDKFKEDSETIHFKSYEFQCNCCLQTMTEPSLKLYLEIIRYNFDEPIKVISGYRCSNHNKEVGGAVKSKHLTGYAADIQVYNNKSIKVHSFCDKLFVKHGGLGRYDYFTHVDVRNSIARW